MSASACQRNLLSEAVSSSTHKRRSIFSYSPSNPASRPLARMPMLGSRVCSARTNARHISTLSWSTPQVAHSGTSSNRHQTDALDLVTLHGGHHSASLQLYGFIQYVVSRIVTSSCTISSSALTRGCYSSTSGAPCHSSHQRGMVPVLLQGSTVLYHVERATISRRRFCLHTRRHLSRWRYPTMKVVVLTIQGLT